MGRSTTVFVGNIAYNTSEEQLQEMLSQIGPILSFRVVYDRETGKPKGYAFCEYPDAEMALSAIRNLNGTEFNGRTLRVDLADSDKRELGQSAATMETGNSNPSTVASNVKSSASSVSGATGNIQGLSSLGSKGSLEQLSYQQIHEIMLQMKALALQNPDQVRQLLMTNPQLTYALLQGQIMLGLAPTTGIPSQPTASSTTNNSVGDVMNQTFYSNNVMAPNLPSGFGMGTSNDMIQQAALLQNIINLTPAELESLPPEQRAQVIQLKATLSAQMGPSGLGSSGYPSSG